MLQRTWKVKIYYTGRDGLERAIGPYGDRTKINCRIINVIQIIDGTRHTRGVIKKKITKIASKI